MCTVLNAGLALWQKADLLQANISANKISFPQGQSYTKRKYLLTAPKIWIENSRKWLIINHKYQY